MASGPKVNWTPPAAPSKAKVGATRGEVKVSLVEQDNDWPEVAKWCQESQRFTVTAEGKSPLTDEKLMDLLKKSEDVVDMLFGPDPMLQMKQARAEGEVDDTFQRTTDLYEAEPVSKACNDAVKKAVLAIRDGIY